MNRLALFALLTAPVLPGSRIQAQSLSRNDSLGLLLVGSQAGADHQIGRHR